MQISRFGAVVFSVVVVCRFMRAEKSVLKPVVPNFCEHRCRDTTKCCQFKYCAFDLSCHLITADSRSCPKRNHMPKGDTDTKRTCPNDVNVTMTGRDNKYQKDSQRVMPFYRKTRKKKAMCRRTQCKNTSNKITENKSPSCILYSQENKRVKSDELITLAMPLKPGMKLTISGSSVKNVKFSQLTFTTDPKHPKNLMEWLHLIITWKIKRLAFTQGMHGVKFYNGSFPITDKSHFSLSIELLSNSTKLYADRVLIKSLQFLPELKDVYLRMYSKLHRLVIQKTGEGCEEADNGIP